MILKRGAVFMLSVFMLTALAGCKPPAKEEMSLTLIKKEDSEEREYRNNWIETHYPEIAEMKIYLFRQYPDIFAKDENYDIPIWFSYRGGGGNSPKVFCSVDLKENARKKQVIEVLKYIIKELEILFPKETKFESIAIISFNEEGEKDIDLIDLKQGIKVVVNENSDTMVWEHQNKEREWIEFNPEEIAENEMVANLKEPKPKPQPRPEPKPREIAVIRGLTLEGIKEYLGKAEVKETDVTEEEGGYTSTGMDSTGTYGYKAFYDNNKEGITKVSYIINKTGNLTEEEFVSLAEYYLAGCAMMEYERAEPERASDFIQEKIEEVAETKKSAEEVCGGVQLTLSREGDTFTLTAVNME